MISYLNHCFKLLNLAAVNALEIILFYSTGTLKKSAILVADTAMAKVKSLRDAEGKLLQSVGPGYPVEMEGWRELPPAGELVLEVESEKRARDVITYREKQKDDQKLVEEAIIIKEKQAEENKVYKEQLERKRRLGRFKLKREGPRKREIIEGKC